ncbi:hypothetical protein GIB67_034722 [Kingdonia uniflora]|uniref:BRCT domain-containing protein n=1 Tax=Kingdonia uniflora TaxID=39325 RepID=A0A7J7MLB1_9MAGN|nr:hypothetical protein GIB67_034722 [Kingdonia uniflora]
MLYALLGLVHSSNGNTQNGTDYGGLQDNKPKRKSTIKGDKKSVSAVPSHFIQTDVSGVKEATFIFANMMFYFINVPPTYSIDSFHKMVAENGGTFSMNLNDSVTHCIAAERKGIKYQAAKLRGDIIHYSWILDCCSQKRILHLQPKYFIFLAESSQNKLQAEIDEFSDSYYWDLDLTDIKQLFNNIDISEDLKSIDYYKQKFCPEKKWSLFHGYRIYFYSMDSTNVDWEVILDLAKRRLKFEVSMRGGEVSNNLLDATHCVVLSTPSSDVDFDAILKSFPTSERHILHSKRLHVVGYQWLENSLEKNQKLPEGEYSLRSIVLEESNIEQSEHHYEAPSSLEKAESKYLSSSPAKNWKQRRGRIVVEEDQKISVSPARGGKRKRGCPARPTNTNRGRARARRGNKPPKLDENDSENSASTDNTPHQKGVELNEETQGVYEPVEKEKEGLRGLESHGNIIVNDTQDSEMVESSSNVQETEGEEQKQSADKLEVMVDPLQAMLLDMIPALGTKKAETGKSIIEYEKPQTNPDTELGRNTSKSIVQEELPPINPGAGPVKKKKVSYKDVAGQLLRDW